MRHKTIIFATNGIYPSLIGGIQRHSRLLIEELAKNYPLQIYVIHPHKERVFDVSIENIKEIGLKGIDSRKNYLAECYRYSRRVFEEIIKLPNDAPIYSQAYSVWYGIGKLGSRVIFNPHGLESFQTLDIEEYLKLTPHRLLCDYLLNRANVVLSLGGKLTSILQKRLLNKSKLQVIPNAVPEPKQSIEYYLQNKFQQSMTTCLFIARFASNKGIHILIESIRQLNNEGYKDKLHFKLGGKGPLFDYYSTNFKFENIDYLGFVDDNQLEKLYTENDIFVFPTLFEGMPTVVLEAMSRGMPIITSDVGATSELVDEHNGYLISPNDITAFKKAIVSFSTLSKEEKQNLSRHSLEKVINNFTWKRVAENTHKVIQSI